MKQLKNILIATTLVLSMSACGGGSDTSTISTPPSGDGTIVTTPSSHSTDKDILQDANTTSGLLDANHVSGRATGTKAYLFNGTNVTSSVNLGKSSNLTISMNIYIDELKEATTVLFDSGSSDGNIKLSLVDNRATEFKKKDVGLAFEVVGNTNQSVQTKYRRFMEHDRTYLHSQEHERRVNQLWLHLAIRYNVAQNSVDFFINGIYDSTQHFTNSNQALINTISLGSDINNNHKFYGKMSDVKVEKKLLSDDEIYAMADFRKDLWGIKYESEFIATNHYYVDGTNGDDSNDASQNSPLKTLSAAIEKVNGLSSTDALGMHIVIKPGLYRDGNLTLRKSGSIYKPIVIEAQEVGTVTISGSEILDDNAWTQTSSGSNIWKHEWLKNTDPLPPTVDLDSVVRFRHEILAIDDNLARPYPSFDKLENSDYLKTGSFLSDDHAFYVDEENDLIYLRSTKNPNNALIEVSKEMGLFYAYGDYIVLRGLTFKHASSLAVKFDGRHLMLEESNAIDNSSDGIIFIAGSDLVIHGGDFTNNGGGGISIKRGYSHAYIKGINVSYNQWRNDLGHYDQPDLSGFGKVMFSSRIYIDNSTFSHHKTMGIWFDAQNMNITMDNCYFTQNGGALWYEISQLNLGLIDSSIYDNNVVGVRIDSESIFLKNNVMSQSNIDGPWGIVSTLFREERIDQETPDVYLGKWLTLTDNIIAVKNGGGRLMFYKNTTTTGLTATSANNTFYSPTTAQRSFFDEWKDKFSDTTSQWASSYPFTNDGSATVGFQSSSINIDEKQLRVEVPIILSKAIDAEVTLNLEVLGVSATKGDDFKVMAGNTITFRPLERKKIIKIMINRDYIDEDAEEFTLTLSSPTNAVLGVHSNMNVVINASDENLTTSMQNRHDAYQRIEAEELDDRREVNIIPYVGFGRFRKGHWAMYQNVDFGDTSPQSIDISIAVPDTRGGKTFEIRLDSPTGQLISTITTIVTDYDTPGDERTWDVFKTVSASIQGNIIGKHNLYIRNFYDHENACVVDWFVFKE